MIGRLLTVVVLLLSFAILCLGHGLQSVLLPARGALFKDYPNLITGFMMSAYYLGFIGGTFAAARLIARVGHIRVFSAAAATASIIMLLHALFVHPLVWIGLRVVYGFALVNLYTVMESWLNSIGDVTSRGKILSVYMIINFVAMSGGQLLFFTEPSSGFELFSLSAILLSLALLPLILSRSVQPASLKPPEMFGLRQLFSVSPLGVIGALAAGLMGGAYWGLTAVFVLGLGYPQNAIAWFMAASLLGGLFAQWPLGTLSDRVNRRYVILLAASMVFLSSAMLAIMAVWGTPVTTFRIGGLIAIGIVFGAGFHPLYSLCIAHANDFVDNEHFVHASAGLQCVQGVGAIVGPLLASLLMYMAGYGMLFAYIGGLSALLMLYIVERMIANRKPPEERVSPFRMLTRTGLFAFLLDPRAGEEENKASDI